MIVHFHTVIAQHSDSCDALVIGRGVEIFQKIGATSGLQVPGG